MKVEIKDFDMNHLIPVWEKYLREKSKLDYTTLYIHIPYCTKKCSFCMYDTHIVGSNSIENYLDILEKQFQVAGPVFNKEPIKALYIGGGSPSLLNLNQMKRLFNMVEKYWNIIPEDNMFSFEMHPSQITDEKIKLLSNSFINRISMGVQSLDEKVIRANNRIWIPEDKIVEIHQKLVAAFSHKKSRINIDLLHGLPEQSKESFFYDVKKFMSLKAPKITIYSMRNSMCVPIREGKIDNIKSSRPIKNDIVYHEEFIKQTKELKNFIPYNYVWNGTEPSQFKEFNTLMIRDEKFQFYHTYCPESIHYNNTVSFGLGGHESSLFVINKLIHFNEFNNSIYFVDIDSIKIQQAEDYIMDGNKIIDTTNERRKTINDFNTLRDEFS